MIERKGGQVFTIIIGEVEQYEEYGRRLVRYLESHWKGPLRLYSFTQTQKLLQAERADCYLLGEKFVEQVNDCEEVAEFYLKEGIRDREIVISDGERKGCFCRFHAPAELISMIYERMPGLSPGEIYGGEIPESRNCCVTGLFSPVFDAQLKILAADYMAAGDLYLGMEDMNVVPEPKGSMGDLCYFIHLKDEEILHHIREFAEESCGRYYVEAPEVYFHLLELDREEYQWFFDRLRQEKEYEEVFVGIGCGVLGQGEILQFFDKLILIDSRENPWQHTFCEHMEKAIQAGVLLFHGVMERRYREDILHESL